MPLIAFNPSDSLHLSTLENTWNAACGADLAINTRFARYNTKPATGAVQAGRMAQDGDRLIGFVLASALPNDPMTSPREIGWIDAVAVLPEYQKQGIGSELLNWAEGWLSAQGCATARLGGSLRPFVPGYPVELGKVAFFKARGYVERAEAPFVWDVACDLRRVKEIASQASPVQKPDPSPPQSPSSPTGKEGEVRKGSIRGTPPNSPVRGFAPEPQVSVFNRARQWAWNSRNDERLIVRPAQSADSDALLNFLRREFQGRWRFDYEEFLREHGHPSDYMLLIADSAITGFVKRTFENSKHPIEQYYMHRLPRPWAMLGPIGVSASHRGKGFGAMLLNAALGETRSRGVHGCVIDWTDLLDFYGKFGFEPYRQYAVMSKSLARRTAPATGS